MAALCHGVFQSWLASFNPLACRRVLLMCLYLYLSSNTKVVHRLDCSSARIFGSTNLTPPPLPTPPLCTLLSSPSPLSSSSSFCARVACFLPAHHSISPWFYKHFAHGLQQPPCTPTYGLHQTSCTPSHRLHQPPLTTLYTKPRFTPTTGHIKPRFYQSPHVIGQDLAFFPQLSHLTPSARALSIIQTSTDPLATDPFPQHLLSKS